VLKVTPVQAFPLNENLHLAGAAAALRTAPSRFVVAALAHVTLGEGSAVLDLACGSGRHSALLAGAGHQVTAVDMDPRRLADVASVAAATPRGAIHCVRANGAGPLPFRPQTFDLAIVVHFVAPGLISEVTPMLRPGGWLLVETFGGQGGNWRDLPALGQFSCELSADFDLVDYRERPVGPTRREAASVRFLARRR
jgi:SAM-dependent methyltransferase